MEENERYQSLRSLIQPYLPEGVSLEDLRPESHLIRELNINSSHLVDLVLDLEDHFDIRLEDSEGAFVYVVDLCGNSCLLRISHEQDRHRIANSQVPLWVADFHRVRFVYGTGFTPASQAAVSRSVCVWIRGNGSA